MRYIVILNYHGKNLRTIDNPSNPANGRYSSPTCVSCGLKEEDSIHFLLECKKYVDIRKTTNENVNRVLLRAGIPPLNLLRISGENHDWARKKHNAHRNNLYPVYNMWRILPEKLFTDLLEQTLTKNDLRKKVYNQILVTITDGLLEMKKHRDEILRLRRP